jgi:hypothetical protein
MWNAQRPITKAYRLVNYVSKSYCESCGKEVDRNGIGGCKHCEYQTFVNGLSQQKIDQCIEEHRTSLERELQTDSSGLRL